MAQLLNGKALAQQIQVGLTQQIQTLQPQLGRPPGLAVLMIGDNPASATHGRGKERACEQLRIASFGQHLSVATCQAILTGIIAKLNQGEPVDAILVQLPFPDHLDPVALLNEIDPDKNVVGLNPPNLGRLVRGQTGLRSCPPAGVMQLLQSYDIDLTGKQAVVLGRSILVGKSMALLLLAADATVTVAHWRSQNLPSLTRRADILVTVVGRPGIIPADMVKPGEVLIDEGINRMTDATGQSRLFKDRDAISGGAVCGWGDPPRSWRHWTDDRNHAVAKYNMELLAPKRTS